MDWVTKMDVFYIGFLTLFLIGTIWIYEARLGKARRELEIQNLWYQEAIKYTHELQDELDQLRNKSMNDGWTQRHYTVLQLENKDLKEAISDYKRALDIAHHPSGDGQTKKIISQLDLDNRMLQAQIDRLKLQINELKNGLHTGYPSPSIDWHTTSTDNNG